MSESVNVLEGMQIRVAICDDSREDREYYADQLKRIPAKYKLKTEVIQFENGASALFQMEDSKIPVDIFYMDIAMPGENGLSVARKLREEEDCASFSGEIIFLTKSENHAIDAFDVMAFHYIVKSHTPDEKFEEIFLKAVWKIREKKKKHLLLRGIGEYRSIDIDSILYFEIQHRVITVHYGNPEKQFEFYCAMNKLEEAVIPFGMLRTHKSFIVKMNQVKRLVRSEIYLSNGTVIPVSRGNLPNVRNVFDRLSANS